MRQTTRNNLPRAMTVKDEAPDPLKSDLEEDELEMKLEAEPVVEIEVNFGSLSERSDHSN